MFMNPIIGMIHNVKANTWHPVLFVEHPLPGPPSEGKPIRHKSKMHHTSGFPTREEALMNAREELGPQVEPHAIGAPRYALDRDFPWDGEGIPAMVAMFVEHDGVLSPAF